LDLKLSQLVVARMFGVSEDIITYWENEQSIPQMVHMPKIIRFLRYIGYSVPVDYPVLKLRSIASASF
jgi:hypothetical protein